MNRFNPSSSQAARAVQAWQILVGKAMNRQTITYEDLSCFMYNKKAQGVLSKTLGHIAFYCNDNKLPGLTSIVVGKWRGTPGCEIPVDRTRIDALREKVYKYNWYNIYPPSEEELEFSFDNN
jgi:hypothetical protein